MKKLTYLSGLFLQIFLAFFTVSLKEYLTKNSIETMRISHWGNLVYLLLLCVLVVLTLIIAAKVKQCKNERAMKNVFVVCFMLSLLIIIPYLFIMFLQLNDVPQFIFGPYLYITQHKLIDTLVLETTFFGTLWFFSRQKSNR